MKKRGIGRIVVWAFALFVMLAGGVTVAIAFSLHFAGRRALKDIYRVQMDRAEELGLSVSKMAAGGLSPMTLVNISTAMHQIVEDSSHRYGNFRVDEMFLLNEKGEILAHSDITAVAKDSGIVYEGKEYSSTLYLPKQNPVRFTALNHIPPPHEWYNRLVYSYIRKIYPELSASRFRVSVAVFPMDGLTPTAGLHIIFSNQVMGSLLAQTIHATVRALIVGLAIAFALTLLITLLFFVRLSGASGTVAGAETERERGLPEETKQQDSETFPEPEGQETEEEEWLEISRDEEGESETPEELLHDMDLIGDIEVVTDSSAYEMERQLGGAARIVDAIPLDPPRRDSGKES